MTDQGAENVGTSNFAHRQFADANDQQKKNTQKNAFFVVFFDKIDKLPPQIGADLDRKRQKKCEKQVKKCMPCKGGFGH